MEKASKVIHISIKLFDCASEANAFTNLEEKYICKDDHEAKSWGYDVDSMKCI